MIDAVVTQEPFRCSGCRAASRPGACVRIVNARPDHPPEVESVDLLLCESCARLVDVSVTAACHQDEERADLELYRERHGEAAP
jgi:hypothetical protein